MGLNKNYLIISFVSLCIGASLSLFKKPEIQYKEVVKVEIKEIEKQSVKKNKITKIKETINKDGSKIIETEIINKDIIDSEKRKDLSSNTQKEYKSNIINNHRIQLSESLNKSLDFETNLSYTYKGFNPLFLKGNLTNKMNYSVEVGIELEF